MTNKTNWVDLFDMFLKPNGESPQARNQQGGLGVVALCLIILFFALYSVFNYDKVGKQDQSSQPVSQGRYTPDKDRGRDKADRTVSTPVVPASSGSAPVAQKTPVSKASRSDRQFPIPATERCRVDRCVDGDTLVVYSKEGRERVRLIGCDTPETVKPDTPVQPFGPEASAYTKKRIADFGYRVTLKTDGDTTDQYGRRLALVYLGDENPILLQEELLRFGLARATLQYRFSSAMKDRFRAAQNYAQEQKIGIWSQEEPSRKNGGSRLK